LLKHGTTRRPAKHHLDDPGTRYLLITNADATRVARGLLVHGLEEWPEEQIFPASLSGTLPHEPEGRIRPIEVIQVDGVYEKQTNMRRSPTLRSARKTSCGSP
jgi:hypothetical protein